MKLLVYFLPVLLPMIGYAFEFTNDHGMKIKFNINSNGFCLSDTGKFSWEEENTLIQCVEKCALRPHCAAVSYERRYKVCEMYIFTSIDTTKPDDRCLLVHASQIEVVGEPCGNCEYGQFCDLVSKDCMFKECLVGNISKSADLLGNNYGVHERIKIVECLPGYHERRDVIVKSRVCLETGQWSSPAICIKECESPPPSIENGYATLIDRISADVICDPGYEATDTLISCTETGSWTLALCEWIGCGDPPSINNSVVSVVDEYHAVVICDPGYQSAVTTIYCTMSGSWQQITCQRISCGYPPSIAHGYIVPVKSNGIYYMDKASVTCDSWYQTERSTIKCTNTGSWQTASCLDCYAAEPQAYIGQTNVTKTGRICQRWDNQFPHPHEHTDIQYYPDSSLSAAQNYCRDPEEGAYDPWCMTMDPEKEWEFCDVIKCPWV